MPNSSFTLVCARDGTKMAVGPESTKILRVEVRHSPDNTYGLCICAIWEMLKGFEWD